MAVFVAGRQRQGVWVLHEPWSIIWRRRKRSELICKPIEPQKHGTLLTSPSLTMHNVHHLLSLMKAARDAIIKDKFPHFIHHFFARYYQGRQIPKWAIEALEMVGINLNQHISSGVRLQGVPRRTTFNFMDWPLPTGSMRADSMQ